MQADAAASAISVPDVRHLMMRYNKRICLPAASLVELLSLRLCRYVTSKSAAEPYRWLVP
jgi:hypothetical protein